MNFQKFKTLFKLLANASLAQTVVQAIGFLSGILIIRMLPVEEYAYYTLANTFLGAMSILADSGVGIGVSAQGAKVWRDKYRLGVVLNTGMQVRRKFAFYSSAVCLPIMLFLLYSHGASLLMCVMIIASVVFVFFVTLSNGILETPVLLHQDLSRLQFLQIKIGIIRAILVMVFIVIFPIAAAAIFCGAAAQFWGNIKIRHIFSDYVDTTTDEDPIVNQEIRRIVRRKMPEGIFFIISGQVSIWLITVYGTTVAIAQVGALSRLAIIVSLIGTVFSMVAVPRFAKLDKSGFDLIRYYFMVLGSVFILNIFGILICAAFPRDIIMILGSQYASLANVAGVYVNPWLASFLGHASLFDAAPVILLTTSATLTVLGGLAFSLNSSRGLILPPALAVCYGVLMQALCISVFDYSEVSGLLSIGLFSAAAQLMLYVFYFLWVEFLSHKKTDVTS